MTLTENKNEVLGLIDAMQNGKINGSVYSAECACLKGTLANVRGVSVDAFEQDVNQPAEQWFLMIKEGDKPTDDSGGGFALKMALEWAIDWCRFNDIETRANKLTEAGN
jgi:hypothetical protein